MVSPCPFVSILIIVHGGKTGIHTLQTVNLTAFNAVYQLLHFIPSRRLMMELPRNLWMAIS